MSTTTKPHLPITEADMDLLILSVKRVIEDDLTPAEYAAQLTDDELLIFATIEEQLHTSAEGIEIRSKLRVWEPIIEAVDAEMETR